MRITGGSLSWTTAPGATTYQVNRAIGAGAPALVYTGGSGATSYVDHNLTNGTTYTYTVTAVNSQGTPPTNTAVSNSVQATPVNYSPLGTITNVIANAGVNTVTVTWTPVPGVDSYTVNYGTQSGGPYTTGSLTASTYPLVIFTNLANGSPFYFQVVGTSTDASGNTITTSTGTTPAATATPVALNEPGQPTFTTSFAGEQLTAPDAGTTLAAVDLFWNPVVVPGNSNPISFNLYRTTGLPAGWTKLNGSTPLTETGYVDTTAQNGVSYWYAVAPVLNGVEGPWSNPYSALTPSVTDPLPPSNFTIYPGNNYATITWPDQAGASYYSFYTSPVPGGPFTLSYYAQTYPSITVPVSNQTPTYFAVRTILTNGQTSTDALLPAINTSSAYPTAPSVSAVAGDGEVALNWNSVANATGFNIYRTTGMVNWQLIGTTSGTQTGYVDYSVVNDVHYYYAVASLGVVSSQPVISSWSDQGSAVSVTPHARQPLPPTGLNAIAGNTQATITWNPVPGAAYYRIYSSGIKGGPYTLQNYSYTNAYTLTSLGNGTPIYVVLETYDQTEGLASSYSAEVSATPSGALFSQSTSFSSLVAEYDGVYLSWQPVAGATGYHLYRSLYTSDAEAEPWSLIATPAATDFQDADVTNGVTYEYAVAGVGANGEGPWSFSSTVTPAATDPLAPGNVAALPGNSATTLTWKRGPRRRLLLGPLQRHAGRALRQLRPLLYTGLYSQQRHHRHVLFRGRVL